MIVQLAGLPGTGKSALATELAHLLDGEPCPTSTIPSPPTRREVKDIA
jgi:predicted kinase